MSLERQHQVGLALGDAIAIRRERAGFTQEQVAEMLGIGNQAISRMERGAVVPTIFRLYEFAEVFDCRVEDLLREASDRKADQAAALRAAFEDLDHDDRRALMDAFLALAQRFRQKSTARRARK